MSVIIGIDPGTRTGCAIGVPGQNAVPKLSSVNMRESEDDSHEDIFGRASRWIHLLLDAHNVALVAIEKTIQISGGKTNNKTIDVTKGLYGIYAGAVMASNLKLWPVAPSAWRKYAVGRSRFVGGRDEAKATMLTICRRLGWRAPDDNAADAAGIHIWAVAQYAPYGVVRTEPLFLPKDIHDKNNKRGSGNTR